MNVYQKIVFLLLIIFIPFANAEAQRTKKVVAKPIIPQDKREVALDTITPKTVTVTSAFKPSLRSAAKINFTAATPVFDSSKIPLTYSIPSQNLFFSYQPVAIKPLALAIDTSVLWENHQYIKAGFGNYATPYLEGGVAFGDGQNTMVSLHGKYTSSKGDLPFQQFSKTGVEALGIFSGAHDLETTAKLYFSNNDQYKYGYTAKTAFTKEQLEQQFNTVGFELGLKNKKANDFGMTYHPQIKVSYFSDNRDASEINFAASLAINKTFGRMFAFDLKGTADLTTLKVPTPANIVNNLFYIDPTIQFKTPNFQLNAGIQPSWDNHIFSVLPNFTAEIKIKDEKFVLQAGWIGYFNKNTYQSLAAFNPYIEQPNALLNTKVSEQYAGFKGSVGKHFTYNGKLSFLKISNQPLFTNDTAAQNTQTFKIFNETNLQAVRIHGEIGYTDQEKLSLTAGVSLTQYTSQEKYDQPWGLVPFEITGALRYKVLKDLHLKADVFFWDGTHYRTKTQSQKLDPALDLNIGGEYTILSKLNLFLQFNNVLNTHYQRWNQYDVLGFNVVAGVVYSFH